LTDDTDRIDPSRLTPATIALMVLGFMVFWPLGLAMLAYIIWGDRLEGFKADVNRATDNFACSFRKSTQGRHACAPAAATPPSTTGVMPNWPVSTKSARSSTRCAASSTSTCATLRMARDREEFDRFMASRQASQNKPRSSGSVPEIDG
jgi:hypothetical protein